MTKTKLNNFLVKIINSLLFFILFGFVQSLSASDHLLITEIKVTPTDGEFIEIYNASTNLINLSNVYITDATYATGEKYYYKVVQQAGMSGAGAGYYDFNAKFPSGASINPGEVKVIAITGAGFKSTYGFSANYEILGNDADTPDMLEAEPGSIDSNAGLTNDGEVVILYMWDGNSDLIYDLDYVVWGDKAEAIDKSGVSIDGIDPDSNESSYLNDTPISNQIVVASNAHSYDNSWQRSSTTEEAETLSGGNGIVGHDETSENLSESFYDVVPTPDDVPFGGDTTPPTILSATGLSNINVEINFSEALNDTMAENENNYSISPFLAITEAELQNENKVLLTTEEQIESETYTITVNNVEDLAGNPIASNTTIDFTGYQPGGGNNLFFSEYIEGSSNNKALEIYNGTGVDVNLSSYRIVGSYNGSGWQSSYYSFPDNTTLANGDVWVIANEDATQAILNVADDILAYNEGGYVVSFNGNDARGLEKTIDSGQTWNLIDVIGVPTEDPGDGMGWAVAGEDNATINHTLVRKSNITSGNIDWISSAGTNEDNSEWIVYPQDTFDYIGSHGGGVSGNVEISNLNPEPYEDVTVTLTYSDSLLKAELFWNTIKDLNFELTIMDTVTNEDNKYFVEIPGQPEGTIVYFYIAITDTANVISYYPENAPKELFQYEYEVGSFKAILKVPNYTFCPTLGEKFEIQFHSRKDDDKIILRLYNSEGKLVYTFLNEVSNGINTLEWDGKDESWNTLPPGLYICHLEVIDRNTGKTKTEVVPIVIAVPLKD